MNGGDKSSMRVTIGAQAAVHGLMFIGVDFREACRIVGVRSQIIRPYIWIGVEARKGSTYYSEEFLRRARLLWGDEDVPLRVHAQTLGISESALGRLGERRGWPPRKRGQKSVEAHLRARARNQLSRRCQPLSHAAARPLTPISGSARSGAHLEAAPRESLMGAADD